MPESNLVGLELPVVTRYLVGGIIVAQVSNMVYLSTCSAVKLVGISSV